jgi:hypothetical protein
LFRHLWVEGNELKAVKIWCDTFPDLASREYLDEYFIPIVSGKKKFIGESDPGFDVEDDNRCCWDPDQSGKDNTSFPLLDSWHDVILLKKVHLYIAELELRSFRLNRTCAQTLEGCGGYSHKWIQAVEENKCENTLRKKVNEYWTAIHNISMQFALDLNLEMLPTEDIPLLTGPTAIDKREIKTICQRDAIYNSIIAYLTPIQNYFNKKYEGRVFVYKDSDVKLLCGISEEHLIVRMKALEQNNTPLFQTISKALPSVDVESFVQGLLKENDRGDDIKPEDIISTTWKSGYIDPSGKFYGCSDLGHVNFSEALCEKLDLKKGEEIDSQHLLDMKGWVKISMSRFYWRDDYKVTSSQKIAMHDYMHGKNMTKAQFNTSLSSEAQLFSEFFE